METLTEKKKQTWTKFMVVMIDETEGWSDEIKAKVDKIFTVYLYDASVVTCICEPTPAYYMIPLYYNVDFKEGEERDEEVLDEIDSEFHTAEQPDYKRCSFVEGQTHANMKNLKNLNHRVRSRENKFYDEIVETAREYLDCNHVI